MAKRVIQLYDRYKSTTKVYPLIIGECITPDAMNAIKKEVKPLIPDVIANIELSGDEAELTSLQIGNTKYKIGGGSQLYQHNLNWKSSDYKTILNFKIINGNENEMTLANVNGYLNEKGFTLGSDYRYEASGTMDVSGSIKQIIGIQYNIANGDTCLLYSDDGVQINNKAISLITLKDKVYAL